MPVCNCGCGRKVKFGRGYLNNRSKELRVAAELGIAIFVELGKAEGRERIPEKLKVALAAIFPDRLSSIARLCSDQAEKTHSYSVGLATESEMPDRRNVFNSEVELLRLIGIGGGICVEIGRYSESGMTERLGQLSSVQRNKMYESLGRIR